MTGKDERHTSSEPRVAGSNPAWRASFHDTVDCPMGTSAVFGLVPAGRNVNGASGDVAERVGAGRDEGASYETCFE